MRSKKARRRLPSLTLKRSLALRCGSPQKYSHVLKGVGPKPSNLRACEKVAHHMPIQRKVTRPCCIQEMILFSTCGSSTLREGNMHVWIGKMFNPASDTSCDSLALPEKSSSAKCRGSGFFWKTSSHFKSALTLGEFVPGKLLGYSSRPMCRTAGSSW